jgi:hypothetical protein
MMGAQSVQPRRYFVRLHQGEIRDRLRGAAATQTWLSKVMARERVLQCYSAGDQSTDISTEGVLQSEL